MPRFIGSSFLAAALLAVASPAAADRPPTLEERVLVESALRAQGFVAWDEIELDERLGWEIDDAVGIDGRTFDLVLDPSLTVVVANPD